MSQSQSMLPLSSSSSSRYAPTLLDFGPFLRLVAELTCGVPGLVGYGVRLRGEMLVVSLEDEFHCVVRAWSLLEARQSLDPDREIGQLIDQFVRGRRASS